MVNLYNECTFNKIIDGEHFTIQFNVDDLMISHDNIIIIQDVADKWNKKFGVIKTLEANYSHNQEYLGMQIDFSNPQEVKITMNKYLKDILAEANEDMNDTSH